MTKINSEFQNVETIMGHIAAINIEDGFTFALPLLEELDQPHMEYLGFRAKLNVSVGKMQDKIQVDIGVGDLVNPIESSFSLLNIKADLFLQARLHYMFIRRKQFLQKK